MDLPLPALLLYKAAHRPHPSFPTRRSSDLTPTDQPARRDHPMLASTDFSESSWSGSEKSVDADRKSTRLNSSHRTNSYAVFCLKKKTNNFMLTRRRHSSTPTTSEIASMIHG